MLDLDLIRCGFNAGITAGN